MELSSSNINKILTFSPEKAFLEKWKDISRNGNRKDGTFLYFGKGIFRNLAYLELEAYSET